MTGRRLRAASSVICLPMAAACLPMIAHTPNVERGTHLTLAEAVAVGRIVREDDSLRQSTLVLPVGIVRGSYGFRSQNEENGVAAELGGELVFPQGFLADIYLQMPKQWTGPADVGVGLAPVLMAVRGAMAYAQVGIRLSDNVYAFTTQSVGRFTRSDDLERENRAVTLWQPSIAIQPTRSASRIRYFFVSAAVGPAMGKCAAVEFMPHCRRPPASLVAIGAAVSPPVPRHRQE